MKAPGDDAAPGPEPKGKPKRSRRASTTKPNGEATVDDITMMVVNTDIVDGAATIPPEPEVKVEPTPELLAKSKPERPPWYDQLLVDPKTGRPIDCIENGRRVLLFALRLQGRIHYDEMRERVVVGSMPWHGARLRSDLPRKAKSGHGQLRDWIDTDDIDLSAWCQRYGFMLKDTTAAKAVQSVAAMSPIHPLRARLDGLTWDGVERLDGWLTDYLGVEKTTYSIAVGRAWMISAVARVYRPGCKADHALILEGDQGRGKSTACSVLALDPAWFTDEIADLGSKDSAQDLAGKWIIELAELSAMRRGEVERVKGFIARSCDHYRPSYGHRSQDFPRRCVFIGSTNATAYLADQTGNRRFWPVKVGEINLAGLRLDREQLWAEAVIAYRKGESWWLDPATEQEAAKEQEERRQPDPWDEPVLAWAEEVHANGYCTVTDHQGYTKQIGTSVTTAAALKYAVKVELPRQDRAAEMRVGTILRLAGWARKRQLIEGRQCYVYELPTLPTCPAFED